MSSFAFIARKRAQAQKQLNALLGIAPPPKKKKPRKKRSSRKPKPLIDDAYSSPEPGVDVIDVGCYLPGENDIRRLLRYEPYTLDKLENEMRERIGAALARYLPHYCVDRWFGQGRAQRLRDAVNYIVLTRVTPGTKSGEVLDDDNNVGAIKIARDKLCAWLVDGPLHKPPSHHEYGHYDRIIRSSTNPHGRVQLSYYQVISSVDWPGVHAYGLRIELHSKLD